MGGGALARSYGVAAAPGDGAITLLILDDSGPVDVSVASGSGQRAATSSELAEPLQARATDRSGNPVAGAQVTFDIPSRGPASGSFPSGAATATVETDASGIATAPPVTANDFPGEWTVSASLSGAAQPAEFVLANTVAETRLKLTSSANPSMSGAQ